LSHTPSPFWFSYFFRYNLMIFDWVSLRPSSYLCFLYSRDCKHVPQHLSRWGLANFLTGMALNRKPPDLHLPSCQKVLDINSISNQIRSFKGFRNHQTHSGRYKFLKICIFVWLLEFYYLKQIRWPVSLKWHAQFIHSWESVCQNIK
jgi:hypothetical protein